MSEQPVSLTLEDAIQWGIRYNLGSISSSEAARQARAQRLAAVAQLLPDLTGGVCETVPQINLVAEGLRISVPIPGFHFPDYRGTIQLFRCASILQRKLEPHGRSILALRGIREPRNFRLKTAGNWLRWPFPVPTFSFWP